jgi:RNA polymerase sigma factor (sigma-70 family)
MKGDGHDDRDWAKQLLAIEPKASCHAEAMLHNPEDAKDAVWDVMGRLMARGPFALDVALENYVMRAVTNACFDRLGSPARHLETSLTADDGSEIDLEDPHPDALTALLEQESRERIVQAIGNLSPQYRQLLHLRFVEDLGFKEIGVRVGLSTSTVFHHLDKALAQLARILKKGGVHV